MLYDMFQCLQIFNPVELLKHLEVQHLCLERTLGPPDPAASRAGILGSAGVPGRPGDSQRV